MTLANIYYMKKIGGETSILTYRKLPTFSPTLCIKTNKEMDLTEEVHYLKMGKSLNNFVSYDIGQHILHEKKLVAKHLF